MIQQPDISVFYDYAPFETEPTYKKGLEVLKKLSEDVDIWEFADEKDDVNLYTYKAAEDNLPTVRGDGTIQGYTMEQILSVLQQPHARAQWDVRYETGFPLLRYARNKLKFYAAQKGTGYVVWPRDFTGVLGHAQEKDNDGSTISYFLQISVPFEDVPEVEGYVRGTLKIAGFILRNGEEPNSVDVTYIVNFDPAGTLPWSVVAMIAQETPLCIARFREYLEQNGYPPYIPQHIEFPGVLQRESLEKSSLNVHWKPNGVGSFDVFYDKKYWTNGAKVTSGEGTLDTDFKVNQGDGKVTISFEDSVAGKNLHIIVSKA